MKKGFLVVFLACCLVFVQGCALKKLFPVDIDGTRISSNGLQWIDEIALKDANISMNIRMKSIGDLLFVAEVVIDNFSPEAISGFDVRNSFIAADKVMLDERKTCMITLDNKAIGQLFSGDVDSFVKNATGMTEEIKACDIENYGPIFTETVSFQEKLKKNASMLYALSETGELRDFRKSTMEEINNFPKILPVGRTSLKIYFFAGCCEKITYPLHVAANINNTRFHALFHDNPGQN
jgi:hypothetical protein